MENWELELRNQIKDITTDQKELEPKIIKSKLSKKNQESDKLFYASVLVFFFVAILLILDFKFDLMSSFFSKPSLKMSPANKSSVEQVDSSYKKRMFLLGVVFNENFSILKSNQNKKDLLILNKDWTIDRFPKNLELSEKDLEYLESMINKPY